MFELLKQLCETDGISGREDKVVALLERELEGHAQRISRDAVNNLIAVREGSDLPAGASERPRVMLAGHTDEIGFVIYNVDDKGFATLAPVGGWHPRSICGHTVRVHTRAGEVLPAVVSHPPALTPEAQKRPLELDKLYLDFGLPGDVVKEKVERGDWVAMDSTFRELGECFVAKAFDDRVGAFIVAEAFKRYDNPRIDVYCVGTAQEEVGLRGATVAAQAIRPHIGVAADITGAGDTPGWPSAQRIAKLGDGVTIKIQDASVICSPRLVEFMRQVAERHEIDHQTEILRRGGTDTGAMQRFGGDCHATCLSIPTRNGHSPVAIVHQHDVATAVDLLTAFLNEADFFSLTTA